MGKDKDCAYRLIGLEGKPKRWRAEATKVLIEQEHKLKSIARENKAIIALAVAILGVIIKIALGV